MPTKYTMPWYFIWMPLGWGWEREAEERATQPCSLSGLLLVRRRVPCPMNINSIYARNMHEFTSIKWLERNGCSVICVLYLHRCSLFEIFQTKIPDRDIEKKVTRWLRIVQSPLHSVRTTPYTAQLPTQLISNHRKFAEILPFTVGCLLISIVLQEFPSVQGDYCSLNCNQYQNIGCSNNGVSWTAVFARLAVCLTISVFFSCDWESEGQLSGRCCHLQIWSRWYRAVAKLTQWISQWNS